MNTQQKLEKIFAQFPGIGPRQAKRFVYFLIGKGAEFAKELTDAIDKTQKEVSICNSCMRFFINENKKPSLCNLCKDASRDDSTLLIVSHDIDLENVEKTSAYNGKYFVLGGNIPILEKEPEKKVRSNELIKKLSGDKKIKEIILALNANTEGENTADYLKDLIEKNHKDLKISTLGRGLATGAELEYADSETLKNALKNRN